MKIGLFGGSFNPIHNGHLSIARIALEQINLDQIWFLPTGNHPLKQRVHYLSYHKRYELIKKAIQNEPCYKVFDLDAFHGKFNYTSELLKRLQKNHPTHTFYFIMGEDNLVELPRWHQYQWLLSTVYFIIVKRLTRRKLSIEIPTHCYFIEIEPIPISSTKIREKILQKKSISSEVPAQIKTQIEKYYTDEEECTMQEIRTNKAPLPVGAYSQAVRKNGILFVSGQIGINPETNLLEDGFYEQAQQIFTNLEAILNAAQSDFRDVTKVSIFIQDMAHFLDLDNLYQRYFSKPFPAREVVEVSELPKNAFLEISLLAMK